MIPDEYSIDGLVYNDDTPHSRIEDILYDILKKLDEDDNSNGD